MNIKRPIKHPLPGSVSQDTETTLQQHYSFILLLTVLIASLCGIGTSVHAVGAGNLIASDMQDCVLGDVSECETKTVVHVPVSYGLTAVLKLEPSLAVEEEMTIEISKTPPRYVYPLKYFHTANYRPENSENRRYFDGYEVGEYAQYFSLDVEVSVGNYPNIDTYAFTLTPGDPVHKLGVDDGYTGRDILRAALIGDQPPYRGVPELDDYILYVPAYPSDDEYVINYQHHMLLLPREEVTRDGVECNKIGVSPRSEERCLYGDSLFNRHLADLGKLLTNPDAEAAYLISGMRPFKYSMEFVPGMDKSLVYENVDITHSVIALTMPQGAIKSIVTESIGVIMANVEPFDALSNTGDLSVLITNMGSATANYIVTVSDCSSDIVDNIPAQAVTLDAIPTHAEELHFDIDTTQNVQKSDHFCRVRLKSPRGRVYDEVSVTFETLKHPRAEFDPDDDGVASIDFGQTPPADPSIADNCPMAENPDQADSNNNGIGDACELDDLLELQEVLYGHDHSYLTGKGNGHNNTETATHGIVLP